MDLSNVIEGRKPSQQGSPFLVSFHVKMVTYLIHDRRTDRHWSTTRVPIFGREVPVIFETFRRLASKKVENQVSCIGNKEEKRRKTNNSQKTKKNAGRQGQAADAGQSARTTETEHWCTNYNHHHHTDLTSDSGSRRWLVCCINHKTSSTIQLHYWYRKPHIYNNLCVSPINYRYWLVFVFVCVL